MIFSQAAIDTDARVIEVVHRPRGDADKFPSKSLVSALLHTCSESRAAARKIYSALPTFGDPRIYRDTFVNWEKDVIFFRNTHDLGDLAEFGSHVI